MSVQKRAWGLCLLAIVLLLTLSSEQGIGANDSGSEQLRLRPLPSASQTAVTTASSHSALDPQVTAIADRLRERFGGRQAVHERTMAVAQMTAEQVTAFTDLEDRSKVPVAVHIRPTTGTPMQIVAPLLHKAIAEGASRPQRDEKTARAFLRANHQLLRLHDADQELAFVRHEVDELQRSQVRFSQQYKGIPVWPADVIVHLDMAGNVDAMSGFSTPTPRKVTPNPAVDAKAALTYARTAMPDGATATATTPTLVFHALDGASPRLAWKTELTASDTERWLVVVDAVSGTILTAYNQVMHANVAGSGVDLFGKTVPLNVFQNGSVFGMVDTSKPSFNSTASLLSFDSGTIIILDARNLDDVNNRFLVTSTSPTVGWLPDAVSASFSISQAYDYFRERHNRNSLDGQGGSIVGVVRVGRNFANASWIQDLKLMQFGDALPYAGAQDVVGHELTHGVIGFSAGLIYQNQSGALNEAFADIFGEAIQARSFNRPPDWLLGDQLGQPLRNLVNPGALPGPDFCPRYPRTMSEFCNTTLDQGGVHINSLIIGHAFYQLTQGLNGAIGIRDAERIFYRALTTYLVSNSQFIDARLACIQAANDLFGANSAQAAKVAEAFTTVGIGNAAPTPEPPTLPAVNGPDSTLFLRRDQSGFFLARREEGRNDGSSGVQLSASRLKAARPAVSNNGSFAVFVNAANDACFIGTDGGGEECLGFPGTIGSVAISRNGQLFGLVLLDSAGNPDNRITIIDLRPGQEAKTFTLTSPALDGGAVDTVRFADAMDFTSDNRLILYDAFNEIALTDGSRFGAWSIYALDVTTGATFSLVPPRRGRNFAYPILSHTSDNFLTFDALDQSSGKSTVFACKLTTGACTPIANINGEYGVPAYTGDDTAIIYSQGDTSVPTGFSLLRQLLAGDRVTPSGSPTLWVRDADFNVVYRRQTTSPPPSSGFSLENPASGSVQSGIGLISGWICNAGRIDIDVDGSATIQAAYGTVRGDTQSVCGDANNGFGLLLNWNLLGNGSHRVRIFADSTEIANSTFTVATLGLGDFPRGLTGAFLLPDFPQNGRTTRIQWQEGTQNFVIASSGGSGGGGGTSSGTALENPAPGSFQSGVGLISGWRCNANRIDIDIDGRVTLQAAYGTVRGDTQGVCGDINNGFGLLVNWNLLGDGTHHVRVLADGVEVANATFTVTTLGLGDFPRGLQGAYNLPNFPQTGSSARIQWQESGQNFVITGVQ